MVQVTHSWATKSDDHLPTYLLTYSPQVTQGFSDSRDLLAEAKAEKAKVRAHPNPKHSTLSLTLSSNY